MKDLPLYNTFYKIESKEMSGDKKYYVETMDGKRLLLCIADFAGVLTPVRIFTQRTSNQHISRL